MNWIYEIADHHYSYSSYEYETGYVQTNLEIWSPGLIEKMVEHVPFTSQFEFVEWCKKHHEPILFQ